MEAIYKRNKYGYMEPTKQELIRCQNCRYYESGLVKVTKKDFTGSFCRHWRAYVAETGYCYEGKQNHE